MFWKHSSIFTADYFILIYLRFIFDITGLPSQGVATEECPCFYREADPLFPGAIGYRWDCEYVSHGLAEVPSVCWAEHPHVSQVLHAASLFNY